MEIITEKIGIKDIVAAIKNIFSSSIGEQENTSAIDRELQRVRKIEREIGATKGIGDSESFLQIFTSSKSVKRSIKAVYANSSNIELGNTSEKSIEIDDNELEK